MKKVNRNYKNLVNLGNFYTVDLISLPENVRLRLNDDGYICDEDQSYLDMTDTEIEEYDIPIECVDWDATFFEKEEFDWVVDELIQTDANHYLVFAKNCRWNGASGYKVVSELRDAFCRDYDVNIYAAGQSEDKKCLKCTEYSHDVPTGAPTFIVALSEDEHEFIEDASFSEVTEFVMKFDTPLEDNRS